MATLQRSAFSFRRKGSSGVVWDDKFMKGEFRERDHHEGSAEYRELRPCQSARTGFVGINDEVSGSNINVAEPSSSTGVNFKRSFSTAAPKKQASFGGKLFKILPVGSGRSESVIKKKSN